MNTQVDNIVDQLVAEVVKLPKESRPTAFLELAARIVECGADEVVRWCTLGALTCIALYAAELRRIGSNFSDPQVSTEHL